MGHTREASAWERPEQGSSRPTPSDDDYADNGGYSGRRRRHALKRPSVLWVAGGPAWLGPRGRCPEHTDVAGQKSREIQQVLESLQKFYNSSRPVYPVLAALVAGAGPLHLPPRQSSPLTPLVPTPGDGRRQSRPVLLVLEPGTRRPRPGSCGADGGRLCFPLYV